LYAYVQPELGLHESVVQSFWSSQFFASPRQAPSLHASPVQALQSLHAIPFAFGGYTHVPLEGSQVAAV
jgi:hypothetical protein